MYELMIYTYMYMYILCIWPLTGNNCKRNIEWLREGIPLTTGIRYIYTLKVPGHSAAENKTLVTVVIRIRIKLHINVIKYI